MVKPNIGESRLKHARMIAAIDDGQEAVFANGGAVAKVKAAAFCLCSIHKWKITEKRLLKPCETNVPFIDAFCLCLQHQVDNLIRRTCNNFYYLSFTFVAILT